MRTNSFYTRFCLMMIQSAILAGCTGGHKARNSTASMRAKNSAAKDLSKQTADAPVVIETKADAGADTSKNSTPAAKTSVDASAGAAAPAATNKDIGKGSTANSPAAQDSAAGSTTTKSGDKTVTTTATTKTADPSATPVVNVDATATSKDTAATKDTAKTAAVAKTDVAAKPEAAAAKSEESQNSIDKRKGKLAAGSLYVDEKGNKIDQSDKPCSIDVVEKQSNLVMEIKLGDLTQIQPIKKDILDNHLVKLQKIEKPITFDYFSMNPISIVMVMMASFDSKEKQESGVAISRSYFVFNSDKVKTKEDADKAIDQATEKIINEKDFKETDYVQDIYKFLVKDKKITQVKYLNRRAISGTAAKSVSKQLGDSEFNNEANMTCVLTD